MSGAALSGAALSGAALSGVALSGVALPGVALPGVALPGVALPGAACRAGHEHDRNSLKAAFALATRSLELTEHSAYGTLANITSVSQWVKPSDSYSPIAAVLVSST